jgi:hypothetical protein
VFEHPSLLYSIQPLKPTKVLKITKDFQETISVVTMVRFCLTVDSHEVTGELTATAGYADNMYGMDVVFDDLYGVDIRESGLFTLEQVDEIEAWVIENITLPIVEE